MSKSADLLKDAREAFKQASDAEEENRRNARDDIEFARLSDQWPAKIKAKREAESRPCLTVNMLPKFMRQVVNDIRQNRPAIKVRPADSYADVKTAEVYTGLIRNIEQQSRADTAWDTAAEHAVSGGWGYTTVAVEYAHDDSFDQDIRIKRVANQFSIYGDPNSTEADSSDWNTAFQVELMTKDQFRRRFKGADEVDWNDASYRDLTAPWREGEEILVAGWWTREEVAKTILKLSDGTVVSEEDFLRPIDGIARRDIAEAMGVTVVAQRTAPGYQVKFRLLTGAEVLDEKDWPGKYIPIIPVYGEDINLDGKRILKSLIRDARDPQINFNYWRTAATELIALAPKAPFVGPVGAFDTDERWETANTDNHPYLEYDPVGQPPQRQPFAGLPAGALNQAMLANDDMKAVIGMFDASLGAKSNETSGKAILARQREGDVATFHFADNLSRAIRHAGAIILDLIPKVYSGERVIRILGEDGKPQNVQLGPRPQAMPGAPMQPPQVPGQPGTPGPAQAADAAQPGQEPSVAPQIFDLTVGKYDLVVQAGPSYTTRREETAAALTDIIRAMPQSAAVLAPTLFKALDVPGIEEIQAKLEQVAEQSKPPDPAQAKMAEAQVNAQVKAMEVQAQAKADADKAQADYVLMQQKQAGEMQLAREKAQNEFELERQKAVWQAELDAWKVTQQADLAERQATQKAALADRESAQAAEREIAAETTKAQRMPKQPDVGKSVAEAIQAAFTNLPPLRVEMPRVKRTPVRRPDGLIDHTIDEPIPEPTGMMN